MDHTERLAAYLAGELTADERAALEAELAGDPDLRAELAAIRRADEALSGLPAAEPPAGFESRLRDRLAPVVAAEVGHRTAPAADELAARRPRWRRLPALTAAAAAVLTLVVGGVVLTELLPADDEAAFTTADDALEAEPHVEDLDQPDAPEAAPGPAVVADDRELDDAVVAELLDGEELAMIVARGLDSEAGSELAGRFQHELGVQTAPMPEEAPTDPDPGLTTRAGEPLAPPVATDVARCLEQLLEPGVTAIPAYVEVGRVDGSDALLFGLVTLDPNSDAFTRAEAWVLERDTCQVVQFEQD